MSEKIQGSLPIFNVATIHSVKANLVKGATAPSNNTVIPAGWPLVAKGDGTYEVFTKAAVGAQLTGTAGSQGTSVTVPHKAIGILAEPITVAATMPTGVKVVYAGEVYLDGLRAATEIAASDVADHVFLNADGHITFVERTNAQIWDLV